MNWREIPKHDWRLLYPSLAIFLCATLTVMSVTWWDHIRQATAQHRLTSLQQQLSHSHGVTLDRQKALQLAQAHQQYLTRPGKFHHLQHSEPRLEWLEHLAKIRKENPPLQLNYQIEAQRPLLSATASGNPALLSSRMQLRYFARHEADFSHVHQLIQAIPGLPLPLMCKITRNRAAVSALEVLCDYAWISVGKLPIAAKGQP